jgi:lipopolysaccharide/colanic/teichoic acid biosynthesis glycosyltransferase
LENYGPYRARLLKVKPGLTGLWQVSGRTNIPYNERVRLDMYYIENRSILLDLQILWRTVGTVLARKGAV